MALIIGDGLIARAFSSTIFNEPLVIFASGVSNSKEVKESNFEREINKINEVIKTYPELPFVYFSTCSIYQKKTSAYIDHKLKIESYIRNNCKFFYIFRLPQVVGVDVKSNSSTLINFFIRSFYSSVDIKLEKKATRYLLDVIDLVELVTFCLNNSLGKNKINNISPAYKCSVIDIFEEIGIILNMPASHGIVVDEGESYTIPIDFLSEILRFDHSIFSENYWNSVLRNNVIPISKKMSC